MPVKKKTDNEAPKAAVKKKASTEDSKIAAAAKTVKSAVKTAVKKATKAITADDKPVAPKKKADVAKVAAKPVAAKKTAAKPAAKAPTAKPAAAKSAASAKSAQAKKTAATVKSVPAEEAGVTKMKSPAKKATAKPAAAAAKVPAKKAAAGAKKAPAKKAPVKKSAAKKSEKIVQPEESEIDALNPTDVKMQFFHEQRKVHEVGEGRDLPHDYGDTRIVVMVRDPEWVFAYWEVNDEVREELKLFRTGHDRRVVLRFYKVDGRDWPSEPAHYTFDVEVGPYSSSWYLRMPEPDSQWVAELGMFDHEGNYISIARSNVIIMPRDRISEETDTQWMIVEETFRKLYEAAGAFTLREMRGSEEIIRVLQKQVGMALSGEGLSSGSLSSGSQVLPSPKNSKDFHLQVHTEMVLYGSTEPDATVTVQGRRIGLNQDGTFSLRFSLPDGEQVLGVKAVNADGDMSREITPVVKKTTR